jgi:hypothetical protein
MDVVQKRLQDEKRRFKDHIKELNDKGIQKSTALNDVKQTLKEEIEYKREINNLKKLDQEECLLRYKNIHDLYKTNLLRKLNEKKDRA